MARLAPTPVLGLELPDPATIEPWSTADFIVAPFQSLDTAIGADRARLTTLEGKVNPRIVVPAAVAFGGGATVDPNTGIVTATNVSQLRLDNAFPVEDAIYEVFVDSDTGVAGADATTDLFVNLGITGTYRSTLSSRLTDYPAGAPSTATPAATTNAEVLTNSTAAASPFTFHGLVYGAKKASTNTRIEYHVTFGGAGGRRDGAISNNTAQEDTSFRFGLSGSGTGWSGRAMIRRVI